MLDSFDCEFGVVGGQTPAQPPRFHFISTGIGATYGCFRQGNNLRMVGVVSDRAHSQDGWGWWPPAVWLLVQS